MSESGRYLLMALMASAALVVCEAKAQDAAKPAYLIPVSRPSNAHSIWCIV